MTRVLLGMPVALAFAVSSLAFAQEIEIQQQPAPEQQTQPVYEQQPTQPAEAQAPQQAQQPQAQQPQAQQPQAQQPQARPVSNDISLSEVPEAVRKAIEAEVGDGMIEDIELDMERGQRVYEVEYQRDGVEYEVDFAEDGRILEKHRD